MTTTISWGNGDKLYITYTGYGNGTITITSDPNEGSMARIKTITVVTADRLRKKTITVMQACKRESFLVKNGNVADEYKTAEGDFYVLID